MRSFIRRVVTVTMLAAPLAALAADAAPHGSANCTPPAHANRMDRPAASSTPSSGRDARRARHARNEPGDRLQDLAGRNGFANSFDSP